MQIIRRKSDNLVMYAGADLTAGEISALGAGWCDTRVSAATCDVISGVTLPAGWLPDCWTYNAGTWAVVSGKQDQVDVRLGIPAASVPTITSATPGAVLTSEGALTSYVDITWAAVNTAESYEIRYARTTDANWSAWTVQAGLGAAANTYRLTGLVPGKDYKIGIRAKCLWGMSDWSSDFTFTSVFPSTPPADVSGFSGSFANNLVTLSWTLLDSLNLNSYEIRQGSTWATATVIRTGEYAGKWTFRPTATGNVTYLIKARDAVGNYSVNASSTTVAIPSAGVPTAIACSGVMQGIAVTVTYPQTADTDYCEIWAATSNDRSTAVLVGITRDGKFQHQALGNAATRYYWARTKNVFGEFSAYYPTSATGGVLGATVSDPSEVIKLLNSGVDQSVLTSYLNGSGSFSDVLDTYTPAAGAGVGQTGVFATKGQILISADKAIQLKAGDGDMWSQITLLNSAIQLKASSADLSAQVDILSDAIGLKLNAAGTVGPGMIISWTDGTHTRSVIDFCSDTFRISKPDGSGVKPIFTVGTVNGSTAVGINASDLIVDGTILARHLAANQLTVGTNVGLGTAQDSAGVTTIIGNTVTTSFVNALDVTAQSVTLGDGSTYGKIETYNFAGKNTGIQIQDGATPTISLKGATIQSSNYSAGSAGWKVNTDGSAEFRNVTARGNIEATSLKADSANIVTSLNIAGNAVIIPRLSYTDATTAITATGTYTLASVTVNEGSVPYLITFACQYARTFGVGTGSKMQMKIFRGATEIYRSVEFTGSGDFSYSISDTPSGSVTYYFKLVVNTYDGTTFYYSCPSLIAIGCKTTGA